MHLLRPLRARDRRRRVALVASLAVVSMSTAVVAATVPSTSAAPSAPAAQKPSKPPKPVVAPDLGPNVVVFDPSMPVDQIQAAMDATHAQQVNNEMGQERYAFLFKPGTYGTDENPLQVKVGYYTEVAGLGASPTDVVINGKVEVENPSGSGRRQSPSATSGGSSSGRGST